MGDVKKIVTNHYPVDKLPEDLRRGLESGQMVRVVVEDAGPKPPAPRPLSVLYGCAKGLYEREGTDPVDYIRGLRDEWDR